ncbi:hypothetical protein F2Q69_00024179 [Brassica cretica]|uniref:Replication factor A C-terminal domain-containing protein n=1 Tax=Brassica cretica TaxID=69181 RepID=A0A8S9QAJ2_BRACR|nr:hypothetical protein F2Q69_00024179 [Brassica cretica]
MHRRISPLSTTTSSPSFFSTTDRPVLQNPKLNAPRNHHSYLIKLFSEATYDLFFFLFTIFFTSIRLVRNHPQKRSPTLYQRLAELHELFLAQHGKHLIGEITAVKSTVTDPPQDRNRVMATIRMENDTSVTMSLFDGQAVKIHNQLEQMGVDPRVVVATSVNPKMVGGRLFLNATSGTHIYFDKETDAGERLFFRLVEQDTGLPPVAPLLKSYAKVEKLSISELNDFVVTATSQEIDFICAGKVTGIKLDKGWCYVSCSKCFKKLQRSFSSLTCLSCNNTSAVGVLRYRVEMSIADETGEGLFVAFDGVIAKLHNMRAHEAANLLAGEDVNPEETDAPPFVRDMEGKSYTFQVKVGPYNFTANHQSFTISRILGEGERAPQPEFVDDGGDDDNGDDNNGAGLVRRKMEGGGCSKSAGPSAKSKKARKA